MIEAISKISAISAKVASIGFFSLFYLGLSSTSTLSQRSEQDDGSVPLISLGCSTSGYGTLYTDNRENISVGKVIFTPSFFVSQTYPPYNPFLVTCQLAPSGKPTTLRLTTGIQDYAVDYEHEILFTVYLDGEKTAYQTLSAGDGKTLLLDVTKTSSIALEVACSYSAPSNNNYCPNFYFLKAALLPASLSSFNQPEPTALNSSEDTNDLDNSRTSDQPILEEESWGRSTVGKEENSSNSNPSPDLSETVETIGDIIDIFK